MNDIIQWSVTVVIILLALVWISGAEKGDMLQFGTEKDCTEACSDCPLSDCCKKR